MDKEPKGKTVYAIYEATENEPIVSVGTIDEVCEEVNTSRRMLWYSAQKGKKIHRKYKAYKIGKENDIDEEE